MTKALIIVDVQRDFCEGGSLAVAGGAAVAADISAALALGAPAPAAPAPAAPAPGAPTPGAPTPGAPALGSATASAPAWDHVVATRDNHVDPGDHFAEHPNFVDTWPAHCVAGTPGADFHPALDTDEIEAVFTKGEHEAAYSGFEGQSSGIGLAAWLRMRDVTEVEVVGIATDHCVRATALDAAREGFATTVRLDLTAAVAPDTAARAIDELRAAGVTVTGTLPVPA